MKSYVAPLYLLVFLPAVVFLYNIVPKKLRPVVLLLASYLFFWSISGKLILFLLISTFSIHHFGLWLSSLQEERNRILAETERPKRKAVKAEYIRRQRWVIFLAVCIHIGTLLVLKYTAFFGQNLNSLLALAGVDWTWKIPKMVMPIGISFFTFQTMSYTIDVYKGSTEVQKNWIKYGTYVSMFPQLIAGPIVQYKTIAEQMEHRKENTSDFSEGIHRFMIGLGKKVLIANNIGALWDAIAVLPVDGLAAGTAWLGALAYTFQIYFDFSGYSDMAIGLGKMFGFHFLENFNYPYISKSITEFWRRWHISLSSWFKEYVYIPLGGNRCKIAKQIRNILVVWMLTGIWHGANWNYVLWGCYYGALLLIEKLVLKKVLNRLPGIIQRIYTMFFVVIGWIIFKCEDMAYGISYLKAMFGGFGQGLWNNETLYLLGNYAVLFVLAILGSTMLPKKAAGVVLGGRKRTWAENVIYIAFYAVIFFVSVAYLVDATYNPFLYFRF